jgi:superoxide dismutase, Cu-Zn family
MIRNLAMKGFGVFAVTSLGVLLVGVGGLRASEKSYRVHLNDPTGQRVGTVHFVDKNDTTEVTVKFDFPAGQVAFGAFHGMHIHANGDPVNGVGCIADPTKEPATWFVSADGHWKIDGQDHGSHLGDLSSIYVDENGVANGRFQISRLEKGDLSGKALIVHAGADNFGNVPIGSIPNQYTPNSADATALTKNTGNAGVRVACGLLG